MIFQLSWTRVDNELEKGESLLALPLTVGRSDENGLSLARFDSGISQFHASINLEDGLPVLRDTGSTNGIYVNRKRIYQLLLTDGVQFLLGNTLFTTAFMVQCQKDSCQRLVSSHEKTCPWCGQFLADAVTSLAPFITGNAGFFKV